MAHENSGLLLRVMEEAAGAAGKIQLAEFRRRRPGWGDSKKDNEFVSFVDFESEKIIRKILQRALPEAAFYGEETEQSLGNGIAWVVDPLDGTTNYLSGLETWAVSIALWEGDSPVLGLVFKPVTGELFTAVSGAGAFRNGERLGMAEPMPPKSALIGTGTPFRSPDTAASFYVTLDEVMRGCHDVRRNGSAVLDLSYLAAGFLQGFWEVDLKPYDVAAGLVLLQETGHPCRSFSGAPYNPFKHRSFVSGRSGVMEVLETAVRKGYGDLA
jgi:myo-inositol-1(or 4)-monophosphatase